jgi:arylsulfatase A-like enzyme
MNDNGGTAGVRVWNAGMRGQKNTPYLGGTRAMSFWRWPGTLKPATVERLAAHIDVFPTLAELKGAKLSVAVKAQLEGRSLAALLKQPNAAWADRLLFIPIGRWAKGSNPEDAKYAQCSVRSTRWHLVSNDKQGVKRWELYDVKADAGEKSDRAAQYPAVVKQMDAAYNKWWAEVLPLLENEHAPQPALNPYHELYWKQHRGPGPNNVPPVTNGRNNDNRTERK